MTSAMPRPEAVVQRLERVRHLEAEAGDADVAEHDRAAQVDVVAVQHRGDPRRQHLRQDAADELLQLRAAGGADGEARSLVDLLDRVGEHLGDHADRVDADREDAGQRAEREHQHEHHREHDVGDRPGEHADEAGGGAPAVAGRGVGCGEVGDRHRQHRGEQGAGEHEAERQGDEPGELGRLGERRARRRGRRSARRCPSSRSCRGSRSAPRSAAATASDEEREQRRARRRCARARRAASAPARASEGDGLRDARPRRRWWSSRRLRERPRGAARPAPRAVRPCWWRPGRRSP